MRAVIVHYTITWQLRFGFETNRDDGVNQIFQLCYIRGLHNQPLLAERRVKTDLKFTSHDIHYQMVHFQLPALLSCPLSKKKKMNILARSFQVANLHESDISVANLTNVKGFIVEP